MASAHHDHIEVDAAKILHKLIQESKDEPAKLAMKLYVILQHMKLSGKEQSLPYQVISRAMETVISQHGLDIDVLKPSRIPLASGGQIVDTGLVRSKDKDASDSSAPMGGMEVLLRGGPTSTSHAASTSMMKDDDQGNSVENEMIKQEPSVIPNRAPGGSGRVESTGYNVHQGPSSQSNAKSFEHESPASLGMEESRAVISHERHDTTKLDKQVGQGGNKKPVSKRKKADSAVAADIHIENSQQFDSSSNAINTKKAKMVTRGGIQDAAGSSAGKVNDGSSGALSSYPKDQLASHGAEASTPVTAREVVDHGEGISHSTANHQKGSETIGSVSRESTLGKSSSMEITAQRNAKPTNVDRISGSCAPASLSMPFKEHHLKQLRAQCLVFLAFRNNLPPRKLHLEIALGESYPKEGCNADEIPTGDVASKEPVNGHEISHLSTNPTPIRGSEKEMLPPRTPPFSSSTGSPVEIGASSKGSEVTKKKNKKGPPSDQPSSSEENKHLYATRIKQEADMRIPESADSQTVMAKQLESSSLVNSGKNDAEHGSGQLNQAVSSIFRISRQLEPQTISSMVSGALNDASKETQTSTSVDSRHLQEKIDSPFHQLQALKHGDRVGMFHKGKDVEYDYLRHIVKPPGDISMYSRPLGHMEKFPSLLPGMSNNAMDDQGLSSANYTATEKWIMHQQKRKLLEEQNWSLKQRRTNEKIATRFDKLKENVSSCEDISIRTRSVIELKKLQLLQVQRRLRSDFMHDFFKPIVSDMERLKSFKKHRHGRRMKQLERLEQKMKEERQKRVRERQKEFFSEIESHKEKMEDCFKVKRERWKGFNRYVKEFHKRKEKTQREKADRIQREKINLLKINDVEGYLRMVQDAKSDRVKQLLKATEKYLQKLGSKLQEAKAMARQFEMEMDDNRAVSSLEKNEIAVDNEDDADQAQHYLESNEKYYLMAHSIKESISEQPASLEGGKLREYQMNGLRWLVSLYNNNLNGILADEMGLGKTVQVISLMCYLIESKNDRGPFLVVVPSSVLPGWESEINFWAPSLAKVVYFGPPEVRRRLYREKIVPRKFNVLLTTYEYLMNKNDRPKLSKIHWHYIIIDEGHRIKNASCKLNSDLKHYQSSHRLLLTGTPLQNNIDELWALLNFLLPNIFNSSEDFSQWFSKPFENSGDNSPDEALLSEEENLLIINRLHQVLRPFVLRRLKQKVANELPEKIERLIRCEASAYQKLLMKRVEDNLGSIGTSKGRSVHNSVMELRNICNHPYLSQLHTEEVHTLIPMHYLPPIVRLCGKLELLDRLLPKLKATDHRVLLFSTMTRLLDIMEDYLSWKGYRYLRLDGHTSGNERGALIEEFNKPDSPIFIFLLSIRAGGVGVNLQAADTVIIFDTDWNPQVDLQAQARAHRLGQKRDVLVLRLETVNTVEEQVRAAAEYKLGVANQSITAGFFDNNTSAEDRREYLESLLRECKKEEAALVLDDDALNDLIARSESEIDIFEALDKQRREEEMAAWKRLQERSKDGPLPFRLLTDEDLSEFYKVLEAYEASKDMEKRKSAVGELDTQLYGRGKRAREVRSYEDQWTEEEFEKLCQADSPEPPTLKEVPKEVTVNPCASNDADGSKLENIEAAIPPSKEPLLSSSEGPVSSSLKEPQPSFSKAPPPSKVPPPSSSKEPLPSKEIPLLPIEALLPSKEISLPSKELLEPPKEPSLIASKDSAVFPCKVSVPQPSNELPLPLSEQWLPSPSEGSQLPSKEQLPLSSECPPLSSKEPRPINNEPTPPVKRGRGRPKRVQTDVSQSPRVLPGPSEAVNQLEIGPRKEIVPGSDTASVHEVPSGNTQHQLIEAPCSQAYSSPAKSSTVKGQGRKTPGGSGKPRGRGKKQTSDSPVVACDAKPLSLLPNEINPVADNSPVFTSSQDTEKLLTRASDAHTAKFDVSPVSALQKPVELTPNAQERQKSQACASDKRESKRAVPVPEVKASDTFEIKSAPSIDRTSSIAPQVHDNVKTHLVKSEREQTLNSSVALGPEKNTNALPILARREKEQVFPTGDAKVPDFGVISASTVHASLVETKNNDSTRTKSTKAGQKMSHGQSPTTAQEKQQSTFPDPVKRENERIHPPSDARSAALETKPSLSTSFKESITYDGSKLSSIQAGPERIANTQITTVASTLPVDLLERQNLLMVPSEMNPDIKLKETGKPPCVPTSQKTVVSVPSHAVLPSSSIGTGAQMELHMVKAVEVVVQQGNVHTEIVSNTSSEAMKNEALPVLVSMHPKLSSVDKSKKRSSARAKQGSERKCSVSSSVQAVSGERTACVSKQAALTGLDYLLRLEPGNNDNTEKLPTTLEGQGTGTKQPIIGNSREGNLEMQHPVTVSVVKPNMNSEYPVKIGQESDAPGLAVESSPHKEADEVISVIDAKLCSKIQVTNPQDVHSDQSAGVPPEGQPQLGSRDNAVSLVKAPSSNSQQPEVKKEPLSNESLGRRKDRGAVAARQTPRRRTRASSEKMPSDGYPPIEKRVTRSAGRNARALFKVDESELNEDRRPVLHEPDKTLKEALLVRSAQMSSHMSMLSMSSMNTPLPTEVVSNNQFVVSGANSKPICISDENSHELSRPIQESTKIESSMVSTHSVPAVTREHGAFPEPVLKPATAKNSSKDRVRSLKDSSQLADINLQEDDRAKAISFEEEHDIVASSVPGRAAISKKHLSSDQLKEALADDSCGISMGEGTDSKQLSQEHTDCCMEVSHPPGFGPLEDACVKASSVGLATHASGASAAEEFASPEKSCSALDVEVKEADPCFSAFTDDSTDLGQLTQQKDPEKGCTDAAISVDGVVQEEDASCKKLASSDGVKSASPNDSPVGVSKVPSMLTPVIIEDVTESDAKFILQGPLTGTAPINVIGGPNFPTGDSVQDGHQADSVLTDCSLAGSPCVVDLVDNLPTSDAAPDNSVSVTDAEPAGEYSTLAIKSTESIVEDSDFPAQKHTERDAAHTKTSNVSTISCSEYVTSSQENAADLKQAVVIPKATECVSGGHDKTSLVNEVAGAGSSMACQNSNKVDDSQNEEPCVLDNSLMLAASSQEIHSDKYVTTSASVDAAAIDAASEIPLQTDFSIEASHAECPKATSIAVEQDGNSILLSHGENLYRSISSEFVPESQEMNANTHVPPDVVVVELNTEQDRRGDNGTHISARCAPALASDLYTEQDVKADNSAFDCSKPLGVVVSVENILEENKTVDCAVSPSIATVALSSEQNTKNDSDSLEAKCDGCGLLDASVSATVLPSIASEYSCSRDDPAHLVPDATVDEENSMRGCNQIVSVLGQEQLTKKTADSSLHHTAVIPNLSNNNPVDVSFTGKQGKEPSISLVVDSMTSMTTATNNDTEQDDNTLSATCIGGKSKDSVPPEPGHPSLADMSCNPGPLVEDCQERPMLSDIESEETSAASFNNESELVETQTQPEVIPAHSDGQAGGTSFLSGMDEDVPIDSSGVVEEKDESPGKTVLSLASSLIEVEKADAFSGKIVNSDEPLQIPLVSDGEKDAMTADTDQPTSLLLKEKDGQVEDSYGKESMVTMSCQDSVEDLPVKNEGEETRMQNISLSSSSSLREEKTFYGRPEKNSDEPMHVAWEEAKNREPPIDNSELSSSCTSRKEDEKVDTKSENDPAMDNHGANPVDVLLPDSMENIASEGYQVTSLPAMLRKEDGKVDGMSIEDSKLCAGPKEPTDMPADIAKDKPTELPMDVDEVKSPKDMLMDAPEDKTVQKGSVDLHLSHSFREEGRVFCTSGNGAKVIMLSNEQDDASKVRAEENEASTGIAFSSLRSHYDGESEKVFMQMDIHLVNDKGKATPEEHADSCLCPSKEECKVDDRLQDDCKIGSEEKDLSAGHGDSSLFLALRLDDMKVDSHIENSMRAQVDQQNATSGVAAGEQGPSEGILASSLTPDMRQEDELANDASVTDSEGTFCTGESEVICGGAQVTTGGHTEPVLPPLREEDHRVDDMSKETAEVGSEGKETSITNANLLLDHNEKIEDANIGNTSKDFVASMAPTDPINIQVSGAEEKEVSIVIDDLSASLKGEHEMVNGEASRNSRPDMSHDELKSIVQTGGGGKESLAGILGPSASSLFNIGEKTANKTPEKDFKSCPTFDDPLGIHLVHVETLGGNVDPSSCHAQEKDFKVEGKSDKNFEAGPRDRESTGNVDLSSSLPPSLKGADDKVDLSGKNSKADNDSGIQIGALEVGAGEKETNDIGESSKMVSMGTKGSEQLYICSAKAGTEALSGAKDVSCSHSLGEEKYNDPSGNDLIMRFDDPMDVPELEGQEKEASKGNVDLATPPTLTVECEKADGLSGLDSIQHIYSDDPTVMQLIESEIEESSTGNADSLTSLMVEDEKNVGPFQKDSNHSLVTINMNSQMCTQQPGAEENEASTANADPYLPLPSSMDDKKAGSSFRIVPAVIISSDDPVDTSQAASLVKEATAKNSVLSPSLPSSAEVEKVCSPLCEDSNLIVESNESVAVLRDGAKEGGMSAENADFTVCTSSIAEDNKTDDSMEAPVVGAKEKTEVCVLRDGAKEGGMSAENADFTVCTSSIAEDNKTDDSMEAPVVGAKENTEVSTINSSLPTSTSGKEENEKLSGGMPTGNADQCSSSTVKEEDFKECGSSVEDSKAHTSSGNRMKTLDTIVEEVSLEGHDDPPFPITTRDEDLVVDGQSREGSAVSLKSEDLMGIPPSGSKEIETLTASAVPSSFTSENEASKVDALAMQDDSKMITNSDDPMITSEVASDLKDNSSSSREEAPMVDAESEQSWMENENPADQMAISQDAADSDKVTMAVSTCSPSSTKDEVEDGCGKDPSAAVINSSEPMDASGVSVQGNETPAQDATDDSGQ